jgi:hypothetical protein
MALYKILNKFEEEGEIAKKKKGQMGPSKECPDY